MDNFYDFMGLLHVGCSLKPNGYENEGAWENGFGKTTDFAKAARADQGGALA